MKHTSLAIIIGTLSACAADPGAESIAREAETEICHHGHPLRVAAHAVPGHLGHGDRLGRCGPVVLVDLRADAGIVADGDGRVSTWQDQSGNGFDATAIGSPQRLVDALGRSVVRFRGDGAQLISAPHVPVEGTLFIAFGGRDGAPAVGRPVGWGDSAVGSGGVDILPLPGVGVDAVLRRNGAAGDLVLAPSAAPLEIDAVSWGPAGVTFERRLPDGTRLASASTAITSVSDAGFALHLGSSGDGGQWFDGDVAELIVDATQLDAAARATGLDVLGQRWLRATPPSTVGFASATTFAAGASPSGVAVGDLDHDGHPDLVVSNGQGGDLSVLLGNGDATFRPAVAYPCPSNPGAPVLADLDADGRLDVVVPNLNGTVSVLLGNGDGTLRPARTFDAGATPEAVAVADLDGDGRLDLVATNQSGVNTVSVLLGNGDGTFRARQAYAVGMTPLTVAIADLDGDGVRDVVAGNYSDGTVSVLRGNGDGTLQAATGDAAGSTPTAVALADLDGDGWVDVVVASFADGAIDVLHNRGDGTLQPATAYPTQAGTSGLAIADLDGDLRPDIAAANAGSATVTILRGRGDGSFASLGTVATGPGPVSVAIADLDGDGRLDLVTANRDGNSVSVLVAQ